MYENKEHPCYGLDCKNCFQCKFDMDIFAEDTDTKNNDKKEKEMKKVCNYCGHLIKDYGENATRFFAARCNKKRMTQTSKPWVIDIDCYEMGDIETPEWCPLMNELKDENPSNVGQEVKENEDTTPKPFKDLSYMEKKDVLKSMPHRLNWEDIKEDEYYLIPRIMSTSKKIIHVISKNDDYLICREISEYTNREYSYSTTIYNCDIEAVFMVKIHNF